MKIREVCAKRYGAVIIAVTLVCTFLSMVLIADHYRSWYKMWDFLNIDHPRYIWGDLYVILYPLHCFEQGNLDFSSKPCHDKYAIFNYPMLWLQFASLLGVSMEHTNAIALGMIALLCFTFLSLFQRSTVLEGIIASIAVISPASLFAMQRANCEEIIFAMLVLVCLLPEAKALFVRPMLIFLAAVLKLYPALAFPIFFMNTRSRRERILLLVCAAGFVCYCLLKIKEIAYIQKITLHGIYPAFGVNVLPERLPFSNALHVYLNEHRGLVQFILTALSSMAICTLSYRYARWFKTTTKSLTDTPYCRCFYMGASIFVFMFFAQGHNWAYRLLFLIACLPLCMQWAATRRLRLRLHGSVLTANILLTLWLNTLLPMLGDVFSWLVCIHLAMILLPKILEMLSGGVLSKLKPPAKDTL